MKIYSKHDQSTKSIENVGKLNFFIYKLAYRNNFNTIYSIVDNLIHLFLLYKDLLTLFKYTLYELISLKQYT